MYKNHWIATELRNAAIKDKRLVDRLVKTSVLLAEKPHVTIPEACGNWSETKGAYRLFDNDKMSPEAVIMSHRLQTIERMKQHKIVLDIQDTTTLVESSPIAGETVVNMPRDTKNKLKPREARLSVQFCPVTIKPPKYRKSDKTLTNLTLYSILVKEVNPPDGIDPIHWLLLTTLPVTTVEEAVEKVSWYTQRWKIERYHLTLKSGCKVEELQLETLERLQNALAVYSIIAWRILWITYEARETPEAPCTVVLQDNEWKALCCMSNRAPVPPKTPPTLKEAILLIAKLGGFLARKSDGDPGVIVLWRGMSRLNDIAQFYLITHPNPQS